VLNEVYLPHFRDCVDAGAMAVMSAYNSVNGEWCGQSPALLTDVLKQRWGFSGFVLTDFIFGLRDAGAAMRAGQDLEMPFRMVLAGSLASLVRSGEVSTDRVDDAARRLLRAQLGVPAGSYPPGARGTAEHRALAREAAAKGIVVLKNDDDALPLTGVSTVAVVGRLAVVPNLGDRGSSDTRPSHVVTPLEGLKAAGACDVTYSTGEDQQAAAALAAQADAAVVVVGLDWHDEGENIDPGDIASFARHVPPPAAWASRAWRPAQRLLERAMARAARRLAADFTAGDRTLLRLDPRQEALVRAVAAANPRTVVVLMGGGAVIVESWRHHVAGIVLLGYPGQQGGEALADVLVGRVTPAGRLPFTVPTQHGHLPAFDPRARSITYDLWHGYRLLRRDGNAAAFPFGFGLSYTTFATSDVSAAVDAATSSVRVSATVTNTGTRPGAEVVQVYLEPPGQAVERPSRVLAGFARVELDPGESRPVVVDVPWRRLAYFDESQDAFVLESGSHRLVLARHAEHDPAPAVEVDLPALVVGP
jgi:beta-glucosidase